MNNKTADQMTEHHTPHGFLNPWIKNKERRDLLKLLNWMRQRSRNNSKTIVLSHELIDHNYIKGNRTDPLIMWLGHSAFLLQIDGLNILTDPMLAHRASPMPIVGPGRFTPPAINVDDLPEIDLVLISHNHYDHLDFGTIKKIKARQSGHMPQFIVPLGVHEWFKRRNIKPVTELDWWEETTFKDWIITSVPAQHFSGRTLGDRDSTLWCGWVMSRGKFKFYFAGDSGYGPFFEEIGQRLGPMSLSTIPIGGYKPQWFMKTVHVNPEEAVQIHKDVKSQFSIGMHWGTFKMTDEDMDEPPRRLKKGCQDKGVPVESFITVKPGKIIHLDEITKDLEISSADIQE